MSWTLDQTTALCQLLADPSRLRLLCLLENVELSVAELTTVTGLSQSRISTHLARLKTAGLVEDLRIGASSRYSATLDGEAKAVWEALKATLDDRLLRLDLERADEVVRRRKHGRSWAESVAGRMELHYSPGRTWEATARALIGLIRPGRVLDIASGDGVLAELLAERAESITCLDISPSVLAAGRKRLARYPQVRFEIGDMAALPFAERQFDTVFLMHALPYAREPACVIAEAARVLVGGGRLVIATLNAHAHRAAMDAFDHVNLGIKPGALARLLREAGLTVAHCGVSCKEARPPYFEVITALAEKPA